MTDWLLVLSLFLHLMATVVWIGGLLVMSLLLWPGVRGLLREGDSLLARARKRYYPIANLSLLTLIVTGLYQMARSPFYDGLLQINNDWSRAMLVKHIAVGGILAVGALMQWGVIPALDRAALLVSKGKSIPGGPGLERLQRRERRLMLLNGLLGLLVLFCTAIATAA